MRLGGQDVLIEPGTFAHHIFGATSVRERFRHRYEVKPDMIDRLTEAGLIFSGRHPEHPIMQLLELPVEGPQGVAHPYFLAAQFHPELTGRPLRPQPMFMGLVAAVIRHSCGEDDTRFEEIRRATPAIGSWIRDANGRPQSAR